MRKKDDEKQRSIQQAVIQLILTEGFHGTSISKIAKAAGVSPATVYIYYENKEAMFQDIYRQYAENSFRSLLYRLDMEMAAEKIIAELIRKYYYFIVKNQEIFHFIEQFSACPALYGSCGRLQGCADLDGLLTELKQRQIIHNLDNETLYAILFSPVKAIALETSGSEQDILRRLNELTFVVQKALIKDY